MFTDTIKSPKDLHLLSYDELHLLADEIRQKIITTLSKNGGHLGSNLGIVELTIALHKTFNAPEDNIIFDVSHQSYTHKILTNRLDQFHSIRKHLGLSGFSNPEESKYDHFCLGHAGTALSLGMGLAKKRDFLNKDHHIIPVIGDASLTCGLTLEGMNNIEEDLKNFIIVLNDNNWAISKNVGNIKNVLSRLINHPFSNKFYKDVQNLLSKIPAMGHLLAKQGKTLTESLKNLVSPAPFFEHFGLNYVGPIDGHDIKKLTDTLSALKNNKGPVLMHVITQKGKGMEKAIQNPPSYHGVKPFDKATGQFLPSNGKTFPKVFGETVLEMAKKDEKIVVINPAMTKGSSLDEFIKLYPKRCIDVGIAEGHALTFAGALAKDGDLKVIVSIYSTFLQRAMDNLFHDICLQNTPMVIAIDRASLSGPDGATHHGIYDIGFLNAMPNLIITQPRNENILKSLLEKAFSWSKTIAIRYPNMICEQSNKNYTNLEFGKAEVLKEGQDILILALGHMYKNAFEIKDILEKDGIYPTIVDPIFIKPLDETLFKKLFSNHKFVITLEEHSLKSGFGSIINDFIVKNNLSNKVLNFGIPDKFIQHGKTNELLKDLNLNSEAIAEKIKDLTLQKVNV